MRKSLLVFVCDQCGHEERYSAAAATPGHYNVSLLIVKNGPGFARLETGHIEREYCSVKCAAEGLRDVADDSVWKAHMKKEPQR